MCVCVCVFVYEREKQLSLGIHYASTKVLGFFSQGGGRGLSFVSSAASSTSYNRRQFVISMYNIHAADPSEKWSLWLHAYGKFDMLKLTRVCWLPSQLVKSDHCHWTLDRCGALVGLYLLKQFTELTFEHRRPNVAYRYRHAAIILLLWSVEII